jgi:hypothetical protein
MRGVDGHDYQLTSEEFDVLVLLNDAYTLHGEEITVGKLTYIKEWYRGQ